MYNKNLSIARIEMALGNVFTGVIPAAYIYTGDRPTDNPSRSFLVISVPGMVIDKGAYGTTLVSVDVYVKALEGSRKPTKEINDIHDKIYDILPSLGEEYSFDLAQMPEINGGRDQHDYYVNRIPIECLIKTKQT